MATEARRAGSRRFLLTGLLPAALAAVALVAVVVPTGGAGSAPKSGARPAAVSTAYPREVHVADIPDATLRTSAQKSDPPVTVLVEVARGVYANPRPGPLGTVDDYTAVFGRCADVNRYAQSHRVARACY